MKFISENERHLLLIVGMQKSGTSLLNQLLMQQSFISNPFLPEGKYFWGDSPPFSPTEKPCGVVYQKHGGQNGHHMDESDFEAAQKKDLIEKIIQADVKETILLNKNPYNSVRLQWLRTVFPNCTVIAVFRNPVSNVFSLLKKYVKTGNIGLGPEEGWWGIKPRGWRRHVYDNKLKQCCHQWNLVNNELLTKSNHIDAWVEYGDLCRDPNQKIRMILSEMGLDMPFKGFDGIKNFDDEYLKGSRIISKNKEFREQNKFDLAGLSEEILFPAFTNNQISEIQDHCQLLWESLSSLTPKAT